MAEQKPEPKKPETPTEKKAETVLLSSEELRAISGGATNPPIGPKHQDQIKR
jgi:hypothetical protein